MGKSLMVNHDLYIDLVSIVKSEGNKIAIEKPFPKDAFLEFDPNLKLLTDVKLTGEITNRSNILYLEAIIHFFIQLECDRCLSTFKKEYTYPIDEIIAKDHNKLEDEDFILYNSNKVLLTEALYKHIFVAINEKQLCKPDCKGLCGQCGCDLNEANCDCGKKEIDPRLLKLKEFFDK